ncbi:MAG: transposase [Halanaerobiales bacterium]|nr:transposase [Halanaerobiales bacterium]
MKKKKGSNNREKAKKHLQKLHAKITNQRRDYLHKVSINLIRENDLICIEDLQITNMMKNHKLAKSANNKGSNGVFRGNALAGQTVKIKWYPKQNYILDITPKALPEYYLVFTGDINTKSSSRGVSKPWVIELVYFLNTIELMDKLQNKNIGTATSVKREIWKQAEIYPNQKNKKLLITEDQKKLLRLFLEKR